MEKDLISIIIPCKTIDFISKDCIVSLKEQLYKNTEISLREGPDVQANRNKGATEAKGEFYFFCDSDIIVRDDIFVLMKEALDKNPTKGYVYCDYERTGSFPGFHQAMPFNAVALMENNYISTMSLIRAEVFPGFDEKIKRFQDWDLWLTLLKKEVAGIYIDETLFSAYYSKEGISLRQDYHESREIVLKKHGLLK